jgi:hypothetical protein
MTLYRKMKLVPDNRPVMEDPKLTKIKETETEIKQILGGHSSDFEKSQEYWHAMQDF